MWSPCGSETALAVAFRTFCHPEGTHAQEIELLSPQPATSHRGLFENIMRDDHTGYQSKTDTDHKAWNVLD